MSTTTAQNFKPVGEIPMRMDELGEAELANVSGGYIGETEKNLSHGGQADTSFGRA